MVDLWCRLQHGTQDQDTTVTGEYLPGAQRKEKKSNLYLLPAFKSLTGISCFLKSQNPVVQDRGSSSLQASRTLGFRKRAENGSEKPQVTQQPRTELKHWLPFTTAYSIHNWQAPSPYSMGSLIFVYLFSFTRYSLLRTMSA